MPKKIEAEFQKRLRGPMGHRKRSEDQQEYDTDVKECYDAGKPLTYSVTLDEYDDAVKAIRSAASFLGISAVMGADRSDPDAPGSLLLQFRFRELVKRSRKPKETAQPGIPEAVIPVADVTKKSPLPTAKK
jgi:hypothetical protein